MKIDNQTYRMVKFKYAAMLKSLILTKINIEINFLKTKLF